MTLSPGLCNVTRTCLCNWWLPTKTTERKTWLCNCSSASSSLWSYYHLNTNLKITPWQFCFSISPITSLVTSRSKIFQFCLFLAKKSFLWARVEWSVLPRLVLSHYTRVYLVLMAPWSMCIGMNHAFRFFAAWLRPTVLSMSEAKHGLLAYFVCHTAYPLR